MSLPTDPASLYNIPAGPPPPGVTPNFTDPPSRAVPLIVNNVVFLTLSMFAVAIRIHARLAHRQQKLGWDDFCCIVGVLGSITHTGLTLNAVSFGYGRHIWDIRLSNLTRDHTFQVTSIDLMFGITMYFIKLSLLLYFDRLFHIERFIRRLIQIGIACCTVIFLLGLSIAIFRLNQCVNAYTAPKVCFTDTLRDITIALAALHTATDIYIFLIPLYGISRLQMSKKVKTKLLIPFLVGFVACGAGVARLGITVGTQRNTDVFWYAATTSQLSCVEMKLGIICGCLVFVPAWYNVSKTGISKVYSYIITKTGYSKTSLVVSDDRSNSRALSREKSPDHQDQKLFNRDGTYQMKVMTTVRGNVAGSVVDLEDAATTLDDQTYPVNEAGSRERLHGIAVQTNVSQYAERI